MQQSQQHNKTQDAQALKDDTTMLNEDAFAYSSHPTLCPYGEYTYAAQHAL